MGCSSPGRGTLDQPTVRRPPLSYLDPPVGAADARDGDAEGQNRSVLKVSYDPEADAAYGYVLVDVRSDHSAVDDDGLTTDIAEDGRLVGLEVLYVAAMPDLKRFTNLPGWARQAIRALVAGSASHAE